MTPVSLTLDDKYTVETGTVFLSGTQALVRLLLEQHRRDRAAGLDTAGYVSGYRGSPLGAYDQQLWAAARHLEAAQVRFVPGVNEDLAATAIWGTQQVNLLPGAKHAGVFAIWYGKGPGVDRSGDAFKHANRMGTAPHGGVLAVFGDDHGGKSSTVSHQSEPALVAAGIPVLYPAGVQEYLDLGLHGFALSRFAGVWVGFKCVNETVESTASVCVSPDRVRVIEPAGVEFPPGGVNARFGFDPLGDDARLHRWKLPLAQAYVRANRLDRCLIEPPVRRLGIVAAGKSYVDVEQALRLLGLDRERAAALGIGLYKPAMIWPLEPEGLREFATGFAEVLVVEEKAPFLEPQVARALFNLPDERRPRLSGKQDATGAPLLPADVPLDPMHVARILVQRLAAQGVADAGVAARLAALDAASASVSESKPASAPAAVSVSGQMPVVRTPYFCAGCPHNTSTRVPGGSIAFSGIGCHTMALFMDRHTLPPTQMGGEGMTWVGMAPFTAIPHSFQNLGDGTYFHSGLLAVRAAVAAGVNLTYKLLVNDAVAMTGGQPVEGHLSVAEMTRQLAAERVARIAVVTDDPARYADAAQLAPGTSVHHRDVLERVQRELRATPGVTVIVYDQTCAAEKRRRRKRGRLEDPPQRVFINERVCEGCGDCSVKSNCVAVEPVETGWGRKRRIDQSACNKDFSCIRGFCPSFALVRGAGVRRPARGTLDVAAFRDIPEPARAAIEGTYDVLITGIGGTGVVTIGALLGMAAHLEGRGAGVFDMTGLAQKGGAVLSHLRIARSAGESGAARIGAGEAALIIGCDLVVTAGAEVLQTIEPGRTRVVLSSHLVPTAQFQLRPDIDFRAGELVARIEAAAGADRVRRVEATRTAERLLGDSIGANLFMVGVALQSGLLPVGPEALEEAIRLNGVAVDLNRQALALGRLAVHAPERLAALVAAAGGAANAAEGAVSFDGGKAFGAASFEAGTASGAASFGTGGTASGATPLESLIAERAAFLEAYQDAGYAQRFRAFVERVRDVERQRVPAGGDRLALAAARSYAKLLATKDEYEVARLYSDGAFRAALEREFEPGARVSVLLAPPWLARADQPGGEPRKREFGPWIFGAFALLARLRRIRGRWYDPFRYGTERRLERRLLDEFEATAEEILGRLDAGNHALAVELADLPRQIRGFGPVKARAAAAAATRRETLLQSWRQTGGAAPDPVCSVS